MRFPPTDTRGVMLGKTQVTRIAMTDSPPKEIQTLIENHIKGFNMQMESSELLLSVFGENAIIIDGIAPYLWLNPNAPRNWLADVEKWRQGLGVTKEHFAHEMGLWNVEGSYAYATVTGALTVTLESQTMVRAGILAYTFAKYGGEWKIDAQAWARTT